MIHNKVPKKIQEQIIAMVPFYCLHKKFEKEAPESLIMSNDKKLLAWGNNTIGYLKVWNCESNTLIKYFQAHNHERCSALAITSDSKKLISGSDDTTIKIWDTESWECEKTFDNQKIVKSMVISADDKYIIAASYDDIKIWDIESGNCLRTLPGIHKCNYSTVTLTPNGKYIISALGGTNDITVWDFINGECIKIFTGHSDSIRSLKISSDSKYIVSGSNDKTIKIWDIEKGCCIKTISGFKDNITSVTISSNQKYIISTEVNPHVKIWDFESGKYLQTLPTKWDGYYENAIISHDNKLIVTANGYRHLQIWSKPALNSSSSVVSLIVQALFVQQIFKYHATNKEPFVIKKGSFEEIIWNEFPQETQHMIKETIKIEIR